MTARFINPTAKEIELRNMIAAISLYDQADATRVVVGKIDYFRRKLAAGQSVEEIAVDYHFFYVVGLTTTETAVVQKHLKETSTDFRAAVSDFTWTSLENVRDELDIHVLRVDGTCRYYTGRTDEEWVSEDRGVAFVMSRQEADRKVEQFNGRSNLHGLTFVVE